MSEYKPRKGKDKILMFRDLTKATTVSAARLALQVTHTINYERSTDSVQTKDGQISEYQGLVVSVDFDAVASNDPVNNMLADAVKNGHVVEMWEIDLASKKEKQGATGTYEWDALYMQGLIDTWAVPEGAVGFVEFSANMAVNGEPQKGKVTLTEEQEAAVQYAFRDLDEYVEPVAN